jgi:YggT family protein
MTLTMITSTNAGINRITTKNNFISRRKGGGFARHGVNNNEGVSFSSTRTNANAGVRVFFPSSIQTTTREEVKDIVMKEKVEKENKGQAILDVCKKQSSVHVFTVAATTMVDKKMVALITQSVASFIKLYLLLLFVRVLLTWFPNVNWMRQPWTMLRQVTDPYLNLFRNLIPPIMGQIDFTPILGFMVLQFLARVLSTDPSLGRF